MMDWTDRHCRFFHRLLSPNALLYTEMVTTGALIHGDVDRHLTYNDQEHPVALQLGGSTPADLVHAAKLGEQYGYDEINLNVGCPSDRVQNGAFGACLMRESMLVADCLKAMQDAVDIPVTIKTRLGVDELDSYDFIQDFIGTVAEKSDCTVFILHARKAWLKGLSPKENREIPPLLWDRVWALKKDFPQLEIIINGGIKTIDDVEKNIPHVDGVMIGREAYYNPYCLSVFEKNLFETMLPSREQILVDMLDYIDQQMEKGVRVRSITRHILNLYKGKKNAKRFRQILSDPAIDHLNMDEINKKLSIFLN